MPTDVIMPQMGESIFEGTLTKWLKKPGDKVQRDEPLFEISTDKVDAEIPSPVAGVLTEQKVAEGTTVQVNTVVGIIDAEGSAVSAAPKQAAPAAAPPAAPKQDAPQQQAAKPAATGGSAPLPAQAPSKSSGEAEIDTKAGAANVEKQGGNQSAQAAQQVPQAAGGGQGSDGPAARGDIRSSPLVRRIAKDKNVDLGNVPGTGIGGRITKDDILNFVEQHGAGASAPARPAQQPAQQQGQQQQTSQQAPQQQVLTGAHAPGLTGDLVPMTKMRSIIAKRMAESKHTSAHVHTVFKVDMTRVVKIREKQKNSFEQRNGVKLTYMPFVSRAVIAGIKAMPIVNSSVEGEAIRYHKNINLGIAVALDWGLIVPVVKQAEEKSFLGLQRGISDVAERARNKKLLPDEVQGGTFTITNPGIFGPQFGTPIINQPQVAILGMGGMFKEPVVLTDKDGNDSIAIRSIIRLTLGYDHRIIDGADADKFMVAVRNYLENWSEEIG
ncbi:MAG TPA: dihydrolipoamide acetyltransferase family protein [Terriglobales bacterium]|nr:dihydrolipoamide acetyltransferase family protein [Terriglobales bacterium]